MYKQYLSPRRLLGFLSFKPPTPSFPNPKPVMGLRGVGGLDVKLEGAMIFVENVHITRMQGRKYLPVFEWPFILRFSVDEETDEDADDTEPHLPL
uniref:Uncharacterized protein n=1 Tax=Glossina pallidipes TaxID=7398 RepID=A0A1A9Z9X6_GLOPL